MSVKSAQRFLECVAHDGDLRHRFEAASNCGDFLSVAQEMGYSFTSDELMQVASQLSEGIDLRRPTGVWKWLRAVEWLPQDMQQSGNP
jgi:predicted ribosomally synthesized peptide with nif11-like leader